MFKTLRKFFKNKIIGNEQGSALSVSLIVIVILTGTIVNITSTSVSLAGSTTYMSANIVDENDAKVLINQAISEFRTFLETEDYSTFLTSTTATTIRTTYGVTIDDVTETAKLNGDIVLDESGAYRFIITLDNGGTISKEVFFSKSGVSIGDENTDIESGYEIVTNGDMLLNGGLYTNINIFTKDAYLSDQAPYARANKTERYYVTSNSVSLPDFTNGTSKIYYSGVYEYCVKSDTCYKTSDGEDIPFAIQESSNSSKNKFDTVNSIPGVTGITTTESTNYFEGFNFDEYIIDYVLTDAPTANQTINSNISTLDDLIYELRYGDIVAPINYEWEAGYSNGTGNLTYNYIYQEIFNSDLIYDILDILYPYDNGWHYGQVMKVIQNVVDTGSTGNIFLDYFLEIALEGFDAQNILVATLPDTPFVLISDDSNFNFEDDEISLEYSAVYDGNLVIYNDFTTNSNEALIVLGNLYIYNQDHSKLNINGNIYCTGDVYFYGDDVDINGSIMAGSYQSNDRPMGGAIIDFNEGEGIYTSGEFGFTLLAKDVIYFNSMFETHSNPSNNAEVLRGFFYSEESIFIDGVNNHIKLQGGLYAQAKSSTLPYYYQSDWNILTENYDGDTVYGILINSYRGYVKSDGTQKPANEDYKNGFIMEALDGNYNENFTNIPPFAFLVTVTPQGDGTYLFETSEFIYE